MFEVKDYDRSTNNITFGRGGFQGARGNNEGGDFYIENVFEEFGASGGPGGDGPVAIFTPTRPASVSGAARDCCSRRPPR